MQNLFYTYWFRIAVALALGFGVWLYSLVSYVLPLHIGAFFVTILFVVTSDILAGLWVWGKLRVLPVRVMYWLHEIVAAGLVVSIVSGAFMAYPTIGFLITNGPFLAKMGFVLLLVINSFVIGHHLPVATNYAFTELSKSKRRVLFISGAVSTGSWIGAYGAALLLPL